MKCGRGCLYWHAFACSGLPGPPSVRGCSADGPGLILPRSACLRLILFCTSAPVRSGAVADARLGLA